MDMLLVFLRFRTKNGEIYDTPITGILEKGKWVQVSVNISSITENNGNDPISEIRIYSYLHELMFNDESTSTDVAADSSFEVYIDEIVLVYENKINLDEVENKIYSNLDLHNGTVKLNEEINVTKVVLNGDNVEFSVNGNVVTFNNDDCKVLERGKEYLIEVYSNETVYNYVVKTWDIIVSDLDEFNLMLDRLNGNNLVIDGLYLFDNDIDVKNATFGSKPLEYKGTIDGGNHTIYNMTTTNGIGFVKEIKQGGTIRNIAFLNGKGTRVFLLYQNSGIIENVYVEAKVQSDFVWFGTVATVRNDGDNGIVRNCVFNISVDATLSNKGGVLGALYINEDETYQGTIENCYLIKNDSLASVAYIGSNTDIALDSSLFTNVLYFANANDFIKSAVFGSENGWDTTLFNIENDSLLINGNKVLEYQEFTETYLVIDEKTISVGNIEDEITKVELDNTEKEFTYSNGVITFTDSLLLNKDEIHNIKVYVGENSYLYKAYTLETLVSLDYELLTNTAKLNKGLNNITKVLLDSSSINTIYNEGLLTITSEIDLSTSKSYTLVINADDKVYGFRLTPYDIIVSNATELQEMMTRLNGNNLIAGGRYIFDADIDAKDVVVGTKVLEFTGLIDGRGHIVSNLKANGGVGIVKEIKQSGTIKNIAFINGTGLRCFLVYQNSGTIENVYVEATIPTSWTWYGCVSTIRNDGTNGLIKNCIFNITLPNNQGVGGGVVGALYTGQGSLENCYLLNNNGAEGIVFLGSNGSSTTDISTFTNVYGYTNVKKMLSSISFDENNGWNTSLFKTIDKDLYFGTTKLLEYDKITETYLNKSLKKIAVGEIAGTLEKVTIDGSEANGTYADGFITLEDDVTKETGSYVDVVLTIDSETYSFHAVIQEVEFSNKEFDIYSKTANVGEVLGDIVSCSIDGNTVECTYNNGILTLVGDLSASSSNSSIIILITSTKAYGYNLTCYDIIVSNATELQEMMNRLNGSKALSNVNGQYIFDADIDASSVTFGTTSIEYTGLIDGRGHIISNLNITGANGFVREIKGAGTIKNLALVNCTAENKVLVHQNSGLIENVYVEATINASDNYAGVVGKISNDGKDGIIRNCVFNVNLQLGIKVDNYYFGIVGYLKVGTVENCYLVNNGSCDRAVYVGTDGSEKDINTLTNVKGYTDINTLIDEATFNNENGWSSDFTNDNSSIKFNGTTLLTKTID